MRGSSTCELVFDDCTAAGGEPGWEPENGGARVLMSGLDYERVVLSGGPHRSHGGGARSRAALRARAQAVRPTDRHVRVDAGGRWRTCTPRSTAPPALMSTRWRALVTRARSNGVTRPACILFAAEKRHAASHWKTIQASRRQRLHQRLPGGETATRRQALSSSAQARRRSAACSSAASSTKPRHECVFELFFFDQILLVPGYRKVAAEAIARAHPEPRDCATVSGCRRKRSSRVSSA